MDESCDEKQQRKDVSILEYLNECRVVNRLSCSLVSTLGMCLKNLEAPETELGLVVENVHVVTTMFIQIGSSAVPHSSNCTLIEYKVSYWRGKASKHRLILLYLIHQVVTTGLATVYQQLLPPIIKLAALFNQLLAVSLQSEFRDITVVKNTCPNILQPLKKFSVTKILQIVAQQRAACCSEQLIEILLNLYRENGLKPATNTVTFENLPSSDDSSMDVYRELTQYISPVHPSSTAKDFSVLKSVFNSELQKLTPLLFNIAASAPYLINPQQVKTSKKFGCLTLIKPVREKMLNFYSQQLWSEVGSYAEHVLLWWRQNCIGIESTEDTQQFRLWLGRLLSNVKTLPDQLRPTLQSLSDSLCCHITATSWEHLFRKSLVAAGTSTQPPRYRGTKTGQLFDNVFQDLVQLSNSCEGSNWTLNDLEELPLVEQIPILHRLDHSVHTVRMWAMTRTRILANFWNVDQFFRVTQTDIQSCLTALSQLKLANQSDLLGPGSSVHVTVCARMRMKLASEVRANVEKLQSLPSECITALSKVCRTISLANLRLCFPTHEYWRQQLDEIPQYASGYVEEYLDRVLRPVLIASGLLSEMLQKSVSGLVLCIMCEAWLDHIYANKIKFSEWGALQLLTDFGAVPTWFSERITLSKEVRKHLLANEVLRRCEGVGRLLLRRRGEHIAMSKPPTRRRKTQEEEEEDDEDTKAVQSPSDMMPAEMYVPNQEQWLELRAPRPFNPLTFCCGPLAPIIFHTNL
ncbi:uncharacterized protein [Bemisia tabaci]